MYYPFLNQWFVCGGCGIGFLLFCITERTWCDGRVEISGLTLYYTRSISLLVGSGDWRDIFVGSYVACRNCIPH